MGVHVGHCGISMVVSIIVSFFKRGDWGIFGSFVDWDGGNWLWYVGNV